MFAHPLLLGHAAPLGDVYNFFLPYYMLIADFARHGRLLWWDPWTCGGIPIFIEPQAGALSPLTVGIGLLTGGTTTGFMIYYLLLWLLGGIGVLFLARHLLCPAWAALAVACGFLGGGIYLGQAHHVSYVISFSFIPWILWRLDVGLLQRRCLPFLQAGALLGLSGTCGYPGMTFLTAGYCVLWSAGRLLLNDDSPPVGAPHRRTLDPRHVIHSAASGILAALTVVLILAPTHLGFFIEGKGVTSRTDALPRQQVINSSAIPPRSLAGIASPDVAIAMLTRESSQNPTPPHSMRVTVYTGAATLLLAVIALTLAPRNLWRWYLLTLGILSLLAALGPATPLRGWLYDWIPPTRFFRFSSMFRAYWMVSLTVLALLGASSLKASFHKTAVVPWRLPLLVMVLSLAVVLARHLATQGLPLPASFTLARIQLVLWPLLSAALALAAWRRWPAHSTVAIAILLFAIADAQLTFTRFQGVSYAFSDPTTLARWHSANALRQVWGDPTHVQWDRAAEHARSDDHLYALRPVLGGYATLRNPFLVHHSATVAERAELMRLYWFATGPQRVWFSEAPLNLPATADVFDAFAQQAKTHRVPLLLHPRPSTPEDGIIDPAMPDRLAACPPLESLPVQIVDYQPTHLLLQAQSPRAGWMLVSDRWSGSWTARVNGSPVEVRPADFLYRAVPVPAGPVTVEFTYCVAWARWMLAASWATLAAVVALSVAARLYRGGSIRNL